jgi:hypothetical protein
MNNLQFLSEALMFQGYIKLAIAVALIFFSIWFYSSKRVYATPTSETTVNYYCRLTDAYVMQNIDGDFNQIKILIRIVF